MEIKVKCPAKINLDLKVFPIQENGFHPIKYSRFCIPILRHTAPKNASLF